MKFNCKESAMTEEFFDGEFIEGRKVVRRIKRINVGYSGSFLLLSAIISGFLGIAIGKYLL